MPEPGGRRSGSQEHDYRVSLQPPWALQDPVSKTTWNKEETNKGKVDKKCSICIYKSSVQKQTQNLKI